MRVGCVKEIKNNEFRVGMTPDNVKNYVRAGHEVYIERDAGVGSGFTTEQYEKAGAHILDQAKDMEVGTYMYPWGYSGSGKRCMG